MPPCRRTLMWWLWEPASPVSARRPCWPRPVWGFICLKPTTRAAAAPAPSAAGHTPSTWARPRWRAWNPAAAIGACSSTSSCHCRPQRPWIRPAWWTWAMADHRCGSGAIQPAGPQSGSSNFQAAAASGNSAPPCTRPTGPSPAGIPCCPPAAPGIWPNFCRPCVPPTWPVAC